MSTIIFLNGCGSSGKTAITRSIQYLSPTPWLRVGLDLYIDMLPDKFIAFGEMAKEGYFTFTPGQNEHGPTMAVENGQLGEAFFSSLPLMVSLLAQAGNQLIIDEVLLGDEMLKSYVKNLASHKVYFIRVDCELKALQERELLRRNRIIGLANDQQSRVHASTRKYDFTVDTTHGSSFLLASEILKFMNQYPNPTGFKELEKIFGA